jgi:chromosome segregation ATPase
MDWGDIVSAGIGLVAGGGGLVALYRARTQNRVDERRQLTEEQIAFRSAMAAELATLRAQTAALAGDKDKLESQMYEQGRALERLKFLDEQKTEQIQKLQAQNAEQAAQLAAQQRELEGLRDEKAAVVQQLTIITATKEFLERENGALRRELEGVRIERDRYSGRFGRLDEDHASTHPSSHPDVETGGA